MGGETLTLRSESMKRIVLFVALCLMATLPSQVQAFGCRGCRPFQRLFAPRTHSIQPLLGYGEYVVVAGRQFGYAVHTSPPFVSIQTGRPFVQSAGGCLSGTCNTPSSSCPNGVCPLPSFR